jgi:ADP-ribose pyrophosphatase YjhB (NUDIX family)
MTDDRLARSRPMNDPRWLSEPDWVRIQHQIPIACVDVLPVRPADASSAAVREVGLIYRGTPDAGDRWCLIGGRMLFEESLTEALARHVRTTIGREVQARSLTGDQPLYVAQYAPTQRPGFERDPRQHAIGLTYAAVVEGPEDPQGEALDFRWFSVDSLDGVEFGFGQGHVVLECLHRLRGVPRT